MARDEFEDLWATISEGPHVNEGNWDKILKRIYGLAVELTPV